MSGTMRRKLYQALVNKHAGIAYRYHRLHDGSAGAVKVLSWLYLLWLNFAYLFLFCHFLGEIPEMDIYEEKRLDIKQSESECYCSSSGYHAVSEYVEKLKEYDIISFDVFDTLIFRPVALPTDVFYLLGEKFDHMDFKNIRVWAEWDARMKCEDRNGHMEVSLEDIWNNMESDMGISAEDGMKYEMEIETELCYANPFMSEVWKELEKLGKQIIIVSDMYLPEKCIVNILQKNGFTGVRKVYVSNEYCKNKASGSLYQQVVKDFYGEGKRGKRKAGNDISGKKARCNRNPNAFSIVHVGDNIHSDRNMARKCGIDVFPYQNVNKNVLLYRSMDMSNMIGGAYRGLVTNHLYNGSKYFGIDYEYGYLYGGIFVVGYCNFIHQYYRANRLDVLLFLSRDGDVLMQVYQKLFPKDRVSYVYWSRKAAAKLMADEDRHDFFRRFIYHKVNQGITIAEVLHSMELDVLTEELTEWRDIWTEMEKREEMLRRVSSKKKREKFLDLKPMDELTDKNGYLLRRFIEAKWDKVLSIYEVQQKAAKKYYADILGDCKKAAAVDIGWAGSGALALSHLVKSVWKIDCDIIGIIAGTNTIHNSEPDASDPFLQDGRLVSYLYSGQHNRDLMKKHNLNKDYNVFWELLLSSPTPQFAGFYDGEYESPVWKYEGELKERKKKEEAKLSSRQLEQLQRKRAIQKKGDPVYLKELDITLQFGKYDANQEGIRQIQKGILDFAEQYQEHFKAFPYMFNISGRDAYAPMLVAASHGERYLKMIEKRFDLEIGVN